MDFANKAFGQIKELFLQLTPAARITTGLLFAVVVVSLFMLLQVQGSAPDEYLFGAEAVTQTEMNIIEGVFGKEGLTNYEIQGNRLRVPRGKKDLYLAALMKNDAMPKDIDAIRQSAFVGNNMLSSRDERQAKKQIADQATVERMLRDFDFVERATVSYDEIQKGFRREKMRTAAVSIKAPGSRRLVDEDFAEIFKFVRNAYAGINDENITVACVNGGGTRYGGEGMGFLDNPFLVKKKAIEDDLRRKIQDIVNYLPGTTVQVVAELSPERVHRTQGTKLDPKNTVATRTSETSLSDQSQGPEKGGRPGTQANIANNAQSVTTSTAAKANIEKSSLNQTQIASSEQILVDRVPYVLKSASAVVRIPKEHVLALWQIENPLQEGEEPVVPSAGELDTIELREKTKIENAVKAMLPDVPAGEDIYPNINVVFAPTIKEEMAEAAPATSMLLTWLGTNWETLGMFGIGLVSLVVLRGMVKATVAASGNTSNEPSMRMDEDGNMVSSDEDEELEGSSLDFTSIGPNLKNDLADMVQRDPDAAASVLKKWIGDVA
ncbi:MAG: hypothetical protein MPJ24_06170 [Pirellulaceae bacterium]|nr:hypothetical protein [Pirellulaceae bacterium]